LSITIPRNGEWSGNSFVLSGAWKRTLNTNLALVRDERCLHRHTADRPPRFARVRAVGAQGQGAASGTLHLRAGG